MSSTEGLPIGYDTAGNPMYVDPNTGRAYPQMTGVKKKNPTRYLVVDTQEAAGNGGKVGQALSWDNSFEDETEARIEAEVRNRISAKKAIIGGGTDYDEMTELSRVVTAVLRNLDGRSILISFSDLTTPLPDEDTLIIEQDDATETVVFRIGQETTEP